MCSLHFYFTCTVLSSWHRYNTNVLGNLLIANGANISKTGFAGILYTSSSAETSYANKNMLPSVHYHYIHNRDIFQNKI